MSIKKFYISVAFFYVWPNIKTDPIIQLTLLKDPAEDASTLERKIKTKGTTGYTKFNHLINSSPVSGFFATYAGMLTLSDNTGTMLFPRRHTQSTVYIGITEDIIPIMRVENTVHHWEFIHGKSVLFYKLEEKIDKEQNSLVWDIKEAKIPDNYIIPAEAIIIFGNPAFFYFDTEKKYTAYTKPNIFLPPLMIRKGTSAIKSSLHLLSIRHFFGPLQTVVKQEPKAYRTIVQPQI